jgi:hypothetical protein
VQGVGAEAYGDVPSFAGPWPRVRAALRLRDGSALSVTVDPGARTASGFLCRRGMHQPVVDGTAQLASGAEGLERIGFDLGLEGGERVRLAATATHVLPVVRVRGPSAIRIDFAACRLDGATDPAGWCEIGGL